MDFEKWEKEVFLLTEQISKCRKNSQTYKSLILKLRTAINFLEKHISELPSYSPSDEIKSSYADYRKQKSNATQAYRDELLRKYTGASLK